MKAFVRRALAVSIGFGFAVAATTVIPQEKKVRLNMASAFPSSLALIGQNGRKLQDRINKLSGGTLEIRFNEPGALVPALQSIEATSQGSVDAAWSNAGFYSSKDVAFNMFASVPFGPGIGEYLAWMYHGGGLQLSREMFDKHDIHVEPCGIIPPEASGWFRKEIKSVQDLKGLKMRFFGLGAKVMEKMGVATQLLAPGDIFQALQLGTIDATEFSLPAMDQSFGFYQVAKFYYFPGWHQQATFLDLYINKKKWDSLSEQHKTMIQYTCAETMREIISEGEAAQFKAIIEMQTKHGVQVKRWSPEFLATLEKAWNEVVAEESAKSPQFKKVWASYSAFRKDYAIWKDYGYLK